MISSIHFTFMPGFLVWVVGGTLKGVLVNAVTTGFPKSIDELQFEGIVVIGK